MGSFSALPRIVPHLLLGVSLSLGQVGCPFFGDDEPTPNQPPTVTIVSPQDGATLQAGVQITLEGTAQDEEDGEITGAALVWTSSVDGTLGTGGTLQVTLSTGDHEITLTATDSDGATGSASVQVTVEVVEETEVDEFANSEGVFTLNGPDGSTYKVRLSGPTTVEVFFEGREGVAEDDDDDQLDEVETEMVEMNLSGTSSIGNVTVRLNSDRESLGEIEETENTEPGRLDVPPFANSGTADSFFDVFFELALPNGMVLHNRDPMRMESVISHKPPASGEAFRAPGPIPLFDENGNDSGFTVGGAANIPNPPPTTVERDEFPESEGRFTLQMPDGNSQEVTVTGPTVVEVFFKGESEGQTLIDTDDDGLDEVATEMVELNLTGSTQMGDVTVRLNPNLPTVGEIEERENTEPGRLDLPPFSNSGTADSFFDVFFEIVLPDGTVLHNGEPKHLETIITHKPPATAEAYEAPDVIPLLNAQGQESGYALGSATHVPDPPPTALEIDDFPESLGTFTLKMPDGNTQEVRLSGPSTVHVFFDGEVEGDAEDDDENGRDEVETELVSLDLSDVTPLGPISVSLNPERTSTGEIEEQTNNTPGLLDIPPFSNTGQADSFFDVFFEIELPDGTVLVNQEPKRLETVITHKPPATGEAYQAPDEIPLFLPDGTQTGYALGDAVHVPDPPPTTVEHDVFEETSARVTLIDPQGNTSEIDLTGPSAADVFFEGEQEGDASDSDEDGLDEVRTELVELDLTGSTPMGDVRVGLNPNRSSVGEIEEQNNNTPGVLDIPPFTDDGDADSFFDVFFEIQVGDGPSMFNHDPKHLETVITHKPPATGETYEAPEVIDLFDASGAPTGYSLGPAQHVPDPPVIEEDEFPSTRAAFDLQGPNGISRIKADGPATVNVLFEGDAEGDARDDDDNGLDEVRTELVELNLTGSSPMGDVTVRLNGNQSSTGVIEEGSNDTPGVLDIPPFSDGGTADSFFDVFFEVELEDGTVMVNQEAKRLETVITHKPPGQGDNYFSPDFIPLFLPDGSQTGYSIGGASHVPDPLIDVDPVFIPFIHTVGQTQCPQDIGSVTVTNLTDASLSGSVSPPFAIEAEQSSFSLAPGGSQQVQLFFTCETQNSFDEHLLLLVSGTRADGQARVLISADIR